MRTAIGEERISGFKRTSEELFRRAGVWIVAFVLKYRSKIAGGLLAAVGGLVEIYGFSYWVDTLIHPPGRWWAFARGLFIAPIGFFLLIKGLQFNAGKNAFEKIGNVFMAAGCHIIDKAKELSTQKQGRTQKAIRTTGAFIVQKARELNDMPSRERPVTE